MDKLSKYNQKLLAAIGTLALVGLGLLLLVGGGIFATELVRDYNRQNARDNALTIEAPSDPTAQANDAVRDQEITFGMPRLIDTLRAVYLIPVSQVNLKDPESIEDSEAFLRYDSKKFKYGSRYSGRYNNIVVYDQTNDLVFDSKTHISSFQPYAIQNTQYLLMEGTRTDSNQDKKLNSADLKSFYSYNLLTKELMEFTFDSMGLVDFYVTHDSDEVILRFAKDKDQDGEIDEYQEPAYLKRLQLSNYQIGDLLDPDITHKIQRLID